MFSQFVYPALKGRNKKINFAYNYQMRKRTAMSLSFHQRITKYWDISNLRGNLKPYLLVLPFCKNFKFRGIEKQFSYSDFISNNELNLLHSHPQNNFSFSNIVNFTPNEYRVSNIPMNFSGTDIQRTLLCQDFEGRLWPLPIYVRYI